MINPGSCVVYPDWVWYVMVPFSVIAFILFAMFVYKIFNGWK